MPPKSGCKSGYHKERNKCVKNTPTATIKKHDGYAGMPPMIGRVGGKTKLKKKLVAHVPEHKTYVEPFIGGGSLYWALPLADDKTVINDLDTALAKFYNDISKGRSSSIVGCKLPMSKREFEKAKNSIKNDGTFDDPCDYLKVWKGSYGYMGGSLDKKENSQKRIISLKRNINASGEKLKKTKIYNDDFCTVMKKHDSKDTFHYLDPPYHGTSQPYGLDRIYPQDVAGCANKMKGKVLVSYDNHPEVRKAFNNGKWKKEKHDTKYELQSSNKKMRGKKKDVTELMIMNYNPKTGKRIKPSIKAS